MERVTLSGVKRVARSLSCPWFSADAVQPRRSPTGLRTVSRKKIGRYLLTDHAAFEMERRGLTEELLAGILEAPDQRIQVRPGRSILQSRAKFGSSLVYLVRIVVDVDRAPPEIVTAYRTSRILKYWKRSP